MEDYATRCSLRGRVVLMHVYLTIHVFQCSPEKEKLNSISLADADFDKNSLTFPDPLNSLNIPVIPGFPGW